MTVKREGLKAVLRVLLVVAVVSAPMAWGVALWKGPSTEQVDAVRWQAEQNAERIEGLESQIASLDQELTFLKALYVQGCMGR